MGDAASHLSSVQSQVITWASVLFYLNRYLSILGHGPVITELFWQTSDTDRLKVCRNLMTFHQYLAVLIQIIVGILLMIRTYALYNKNRFILLLLCAAAAIVIAYGFWCVLASQGSNYTTEDLPLTGCLLPTNEKLSSRLASAWTGMLGFDILIFGLTLYKSLTYRSEGNTSLIKVMLRDGTLYFGVMSMSCASVIISFHVFPDYERGMLTTLANVLSSTMISRLMLNLRDPKLSSGYRGERSTTARLSERSAVFTSIIDTSISADTLISRAHDSSYLDLGSPQEGSNDIQLTSRTKGLV
ncbi:hypothetical protein B0H34DRAFT_143963 [Crassisporium funariophilum]|nr:hypothetical protein B0H34DRAFT_143963 [Crassisporium funariophilum]